MFGWREKLEKLENGLQWSSSSFSLLRLANGASSRTPRPLFIEIASPWCNEGVYGVVEAKDHQWK